MLPRYIRVPVTSLLTGVLSVLLSSFAFAQLGSEYSFTAGTSPYTSIAGTLVIAGNATGAPSTFNDNEAAGPFAIGFDFEFGCNVYTQFSVTSAGYLTLGGATPVNQNVNNLTSAPRYPLITPFWDHQHYYNAYAAAGCTGGIIEDVGVEYLLSGTAPNRVLTVEWKTNLGGDNPYFITCTEPSMHTYQVRLYEGSNRIVLHYSTMVVPGNANATSSASIGIADGSSDFISVTPAATSTASSTVANNGFNNRAFGIPAETEYTFTPEKLVLAGRLGTGNEGVADPEDGDVLLSNVVQSVATQQGYTPLDLRKACAAPSLPIAMSITGLQASEYTFDATGTQTWNTTLTTDPPIAPQINFRPLGGGVRSALLTITNQVTNESVSFVLAGEGMPRIRWIGDVAQGGTVGMADGDALLEGKQVIFGTSQTFTPFTLENILDPSIVAPLAEVTYTLVDPNGNYSISPTAASLDGGDRSTPEITFNAQGVVGVQEATLIVAADGETRTFRLRAFNAAPGGELFVSGTPVNAANPLMVDQTVCVGEQVISVEVTAVNTGTGDFIVSGLNAFLTETEIRQGVPSYPLLRDEFGQPIPAQDYFLTLTAGVAPKHNNQPFAGLVVPEGSSRTFYLNMIPDRPMKRYAQLYFQTNGFNVNDPDVQGVPTRGLVRADAFASGRGSWLAGASNIQRPLPIIFNPTEVRESSRITALLHNSGDCDLRISSSDLRFQSGDLSEFSLVSVLPNTAINGDDYVMPPGATDSIIVEFKPGNYGSRRATIRLVTNDSTLGDNQTVEYGAFYWDIFGVGKVGLEARDLRLAPAVIDGESSRGFVVFENTSTANVEVESIMIEGGTGEIGEDPTRAWPALPHILAPGEKLPLWVELVADANFGTGERTADVVVQIKGGDEIRAHVRGYVGTRTLSVQPGSLFAGLQIPVGDVARGNIIVINTGTLPVRLNDPVLIESVPGEYLLSQIVRRVLEPGQSEILEVTYLPQVVGVSGGNVTFNSNATNGSQVVTLGGEGTSTHQGDGVGGAATEPVAGDNLSRSAADASSARLSVQSLVPNPARDISTAQYYIPRSGDVQLAVYDLHGRLVRTVEVGASDKGEHTAVIDLQGLSSGRYYLRLTLGTDVVSQPLDVVK